MVSAKILDIDTVKERISLGVKQLEDDPFTHRIEFGLFVGLDYDLDGMVHMSDLDWNRSGDEAIAEYKKGDMVSAKILDIDTVKERISLGVKQLADEPYCATASFSS